MRKTVVFAWLIISIAFTLCVSASHAGLPSPAPWETITLAEDPETIEPAVPYLSRPPEIDGRLDEELRNLPERRFIVIVKSDPENPDVPCSYRLAYGAHFFYVYVEAEAEKLTFRDRAYQNGDGFVVVLTVPRPNLEPSEEFYVLACSAVDRPRMEWTRRIFWYYNVDTIFQRVGDETKMEFFAGDGTISFELMLPWEDVHPYHPWLSEGIGFNISFTKAIGDRARSFYKAVNASVGAENSPRRYTLLGFEKPQHEGDPQTLMLLGRNHIAAGETVGARMVSIAAAPFTESIRALVNSGEGEIVAWESVEYDCEAGLTYHDFSLGIDGLPPGGYYIDWHSRQNDSRGRSGLSILPEYDPIVIGRRIDTVKSVLSPGSYTTFQFLIEEISGDLAAVKPYETCAGPRIRLAGLIDYLDRAEAGTDAFAEKRGFVRMAYRSELDNTLQPYVVWIPDDLDPGKRYPLLVYLHGSASDETNIMGMRDAIPDGFIALGPKGRGPSNCYSWDHAQEDIAESIASVIENFPIDERNIILSGFSMGGYGVYRTFYETPEKFKALAVFSGAPNLANQWFEGDETYPNFYEPEYLKPFDGIPIFIFHGRRDRNVPFEQTEQLIGTLERAGAIVEFHVEDDKGHEDPDPETIEAFHRWIKKVIE